jgi:hypothetical protein
VPTKVCKTDKNICPAFEISELDMTL